MKELKIVKHISVKCCRQTAIDFQLAYLHVFILAINT